MFQFFLGFSPTCACQNVSVIVSVRMVVCYGLEDVNGRRMPGSGVYYIHYAHAALLWVPYIQIGWL